MRTHLLLAEEYARAAREATAANEHGLAAALFARAIKLSALVDHAWPTLTDLEQEHSSHEQKDNTQGEGQRRAG